MRSHLSVWILTIATSCGLASCQGPPAISSSSESLSAGVSAELWQLVDRADRVEVYDYESSDQTDNGRHVSTRRADLDALKRALILEEPLQSGFCFCQGRPKIALYRGAERIGVISNKHGTHIHCGELWSVDVAIGDPESYFRWFDDRGIREVREEVESYERMLRREEEDLARWRKSTPRSLRDDWVTEPANESKVALERRRRQLASEYESEEAQILALLEWFGSGRGTWNDTASYEHLPEDLLHAYPREVLIRVASSPSLTESQLEGAARFFGTGDWEIARSLPPELRRRLWVHVRRTTPESLRSALDGIELPLTPEDRDRWEEKLHWESLEYLQWERLAWAKQAFDSPGVSAE